VSDKAQNLNWVNVQMKMREMGEKWEMDERILQLVCGGSDPSDLSP
jgi:hypothetical protein